MDKKLFYASIKERFLLNHPSSSKKTYHVVLDVKDAEVSYQVGDCVAIYPDNISLIVQTILNHLQVSGQELVTDRNQEKLPFVEFLTKKANLAKVSLPLAKHVLGEKAFPELQALKDYCSQFDVADFLLAHKAILSPQELISHLLPLIPRFYSIASSMKAVGQQVHLTVALSEFESRGKPQFGTCSYFLTQEAPLHQPIIPLYFQQARDFTLPLGIEKKDIIMIGPGTGVAPFIGFLQERHVCSHPGRNWLFFGERNQHLDFYYKNFLEDHVKKNNLTLDLAFSRDQEEKIYVQHKMWEKANEFVSWLDCGAYLYVCGDAEKMAKDVEKNLQLIISNVKKISENDSKEYIKNLRKEKRYLRDVY